MPHLISCGGGPVGNGLGTLICLPFFLANRAEGSCLDGACERKAAAGAAIINAKIDSSCCRMVALNIIWLWMCFVFLWLAWDGDGGDKAMVCIYSSLEIAKYYR